MRMKLFAGALLLLASSSVFAVEVCGTISTDVGNANADAARFVFVPNNDTRPIYVSHKLYHKLPAFTQGLLEGAAVNGQACLSYSSTVQVPVSNSGATSDYFVDLKFAME